MMSHLRKRRLHILRHLALHLPALPHRLTPDPRGRTDIILKKLSTQMIFFRQDPSSCRTTSHCLRDLQSSRILLNYEIARRNIWTGTRGKDQGSYVGAGINKNALKRHELNAGTLSATIAIPTRNLHGSLLSSISPFFEIRWKDGVK